MSSARTLHLASHAEGASLLLLLFVGMPLKYGMGLPIAVRVTGSIHGALFVWLVLTALVAFSKRAADVGTLLRVLALSMVPFGFVPAAAALRRAAANTAKPLARAER
jgi:integral membrane protein